MHQDISQTKMEIQNVFSLFFFKYCGILCQKLKSFKVDMGILAVYMKISYNVTYIFKLCLYFIICCINNHRSFNVIRSFTT